MLFSEFCKECTDKRILTRLLLLRWLPHMSIGKGYRDNGTIELRPLGRHREDGREGEMPRRNLRLRRKTDDGENKKMTDLQEIAQHTPQQQDAHDRE